MTSWAVHTAGAKLPVFEYGNPNADSTVLLVHGYPDNHHVFDPLIAELGDTVRVIAYDTRGSGASVPDHPANVAIEQLARSWYVFGFHVPILGRQVPGLLARLCTDDEPTPTVADQQRGIALYRANVLRRVLRGPEPRCAVSTTVVAPTHDRMLSPNLTGGLDEWIPDLRVVDVDAGHWWPYTHPAEAASVLMTSVRGAE